MNIISVAFKEYWRDKELELWKRTRTPEIFAYHTYTENILYISKVHMVTCYILKAGCLEPGQQSSGPQEV